MGMAAHLPTALPSPVRRAFETLPALSQMKFGFEGGGPSPRLKPCEELKSLPALLNISMKEIERMIVQNLAGVLSCIGSVRWGIGKTGHRPWNKAGPS